MKTGNVYQLKAVIISQNEETRIYMLKSRLVCGKPTFCQICKQNVNLKNPLPSDNFNIDNKNVIRSKFILVYSIFK